MSENNTQTPAQEKPRRSKEDILEIIIAVFLGVTALATAWASWIGSLHGGNMSTNYTKSNNLAADGNARWNEASQTLMQDMQVWNIISDYQVEVLYANQTGDESKLYESAYKIKFICADNLTQEIADLINYDFDFDADQIIDWVINNETRTTLTATTPTRRRYLRRAKRCSPKASRTTPAATPSISSPSSIPSCCSCSVSWGLSAACRTVC